MRMKRGLVKRRREAIEEIAGRYPERAADLRQAVAFWVEHPRYSPAQGAPVAALLNAIARRNYDVLSERVSVPKWRKAAIAARSIGARFARQRGSDLEARPIR